MADFSKIKKSKKSRFGDAPSPEEDDNNLEAPETAPARKPRNKTGRTVAFATKVTAEFDEEFRHIAFFGKMKKVELLEKALEAYKRENNIE
jgi:hypothetical protein